MRRPTAAVAAVVTCLLTAGCVSTGNAETTSPSRTLIPRPLVERELSSLLLTPEKIDAAMGTVGMTATESRDTMTDSSAIMAPLECLPIDGAAEAAVYADSGFWSARDQSLNNGDGFTHYLKQAVVLFGTPESAGAFFDASAERWTLCHDYTHTQSGSQWTVGQVSNAKPTLSAITTMKDASAPGWACGRALTVENNVVVDVNTCSADPAESAPTIARLIAEDVRSRW